MYYKIYSRCKIHWILVYLKICAATPQSILEHFSYLKKKACSL